MALCILEDPRAISPYDTTGQYKGCPLHGMACQPLSQGYKEYVPKTATRRWEAYGRFPHVAREPWTLNPNEGGLADDGDADPNDYKLPPKPKPKPKPKRTLEELKNTRIDLTPALNQLTQAQIGGEGGTDKES